MYYDDFDSIYAPLHFEMEIPSAPVIEQLSLLPVSPSIEFNPLMISKCPYLHVKPLWHIEYALATVGLVRVGMRPFEASYVPHERNFDVFSTGEFLLDNEIVLRVEVPTLGAETLSASKVSSMAVATSRGCLVWGQTTVNSVVGGVRKKIDGREVVQFIVVTSTRRVAFMYDTDRIWQVTAVSPAVYERVDDVYHTLIGEPCIEVQAKSHPWMNPVREEVQGILESEAEGVIVNINGLDYRCKTDVGVTLQLTDRGVCDNNNRHFICTDNVNEISKYADYRVIGKRAYYLKNRPDKTRADTSKSIDCSIAAPMLSEIVTKFPNGDGVRGRVQPAYSVPTQSTFGHYVGDAFSGLSVGPYSWRSPKKSIVPTTASAVIDNMIIAGDKVITPELIMRVNIENDRYLVGQSVRFTHSQNRVIRRVIDGRTYSNKFFKGCHDIVVLGDEYSPFVEPFHAFVDVMPVVNGRRDGLVLFVKDGGVPQLDNVNGEIAGVHARLAEVVEMLRVYPCNVTAMALKLGLPKHELNSVLYSRTDLFVATRGTSPPVWRLHVNDNG